MNRLKVAILAYPNLSTFEFSCAIELFALSRPDIKDWYQTEVLAMTHQPMEATGGFRIQSDHVFSPIKGFNQYDMVVIAGWSGIDVPIPEVLIKSLKSFYHDGGRLVSFCSGAFVIAATGLLDGKQATSHWRYESDFIHKYPKVAFQENVLFTETNRIYTSAGSAAALDLGLHIIRQDYGSSIANEIAKRLVISPVREGGQAQFANQSQPFKENHHLSKSLEWAKQNLSTNIKINDMAQCACLSRRSYDRHFRNSLGTSPKEWLIRQRINLAREYLENTKGSIEQIAENSGFGTAMNLRHHFAQLLGISPSHYRRNFQQTT